MPLPLRLSRTKWNPLTISWLYASPCSTLSIAHVLMPKRSCSGRR
jgi:hypothetical protein